MAYRIATADGNWTTAASWGTVDATSLLDSEAAATNLTTSYVESQTFTPGAIQVDAIAVKIQLRAATANGTMTVRLAQGGALVAGTEVTVNVSDIVNGQININNCNGWFLFKFSAPVTLLAATAYTLSAKTSQSTQVTLHRNATAGNWSRMLRTTTTGAPGAGDSMFILGEWTAAATKTNRAITMNETASTDYGSASTSLTSIGIGVGGTLSYGTTAATNYVLRVSGMLDIWAGGILNIGTDPSSGGTAIPRDSTAVLEFDCAADGDFGFRVFGTGVFRIYGLSRTSGKNIVQALLNTDEAAAQTTLGLDTDTGWLNGDVVAIASTTRTGTEAETATLNGNAGASSITVTAGIAAAHSGTSPTQAEVALLTRNVMVRSVSSSAMAYGSYKGTTSTSTGGVIDWNWADFRYFGCTTSAKQNVLECDQCPVSVTARFCTFRDSEQSGLAQMAHTFTGDSTWTIEDCVFYNIGAVSNAQCIDIQSMTNASVALTLTRCCCIFDSSTAADGFVVFQDATSSMVVDSCRVNSGNGKAVTLSVTITYSQNVRITGCNFHALGTGSAGAAITFSGSPASGVVIEDTTIWRTNWVGGGQGAIGIYSSVFDLLIEDCTFFGNAQAAIGMTAGGELTCRNCSFSGDSSFSTASGILATQSGRFYFLRLENCSFGVVSGIRTAHTTASISGSSNTETFVEIIAINTNFADATEIATSFSDGAGGRSRFVRQRKDQTTNTHETLYWRLGTVAYETTTFRTAAPSEKLTPTVGTTGTELAWLRSSPRRCRVPAGSAATFSFFVRKDSSYNGSEPRLVVKANPAMGLDDNTVLDTMTVAHSNWEELTGTTTPVAEEDGVYEAWVECNGSAGNVYVDDVSAVAG